MGTNTLTTKSGGTTVNADDVNQFYTALNGDIVPRNTSGVPTDSAGSIGTSSYRFLDAYFDDIDLPDGVLDGASLTDNTVTKDKLVSLGLQTSSSSSTYSTTSTSYVDVTNLSITITTTGRPVMIAVESDGTANVSYIGSSNSGGGASSNTVKLVRDSTDVGIVLYASPSSSGTGVAGFGANFMYLDTPSAGTYTYKIQCKASGTAIFNYCVLKAYEVQ